MTGAGGGGVGAGTWCTGFDWGTSRAAIETRLALLTVGSLGVALTVQTHSWRTEQRSHDYMVIDCKYIKRNLSKTYSKSSK